MAGIDGINGQSLYFAATQSAAQRQAQEANKKNKTTGSKPLSFLKAIKDSENEKGDLMAQGLPPEIAGMDDEQALVFLKDAVDIASDELKKTVTRQNMENYRQKMSQLMKFIASNNYEVFTKRRPGRSKNPNKKPVYVQIQVINQKLANLTSDILYDQASNLKLLARVEEINGMIVDLLAS